MKRKGVSRLGAGIFIGVILVVLIGSLFLNGYIDDRNAYVDENTSSTGVVIEKTFNERQWGLAGFATKFIIVIERQTVNYKGEEVFVREQAVVGYEEWLAIEVGDIGAYDENGTFAVEHSSNKESE